MSTDKVLSKWDSEDEAYDDSDDIDERAVFQCVFLYILLKIITYTKAIIIILSQFHREWLG